MRQSWTEAGGREPGGEALLCLVRAERASQQRRCPMRVLQATLDLPAEEETWSIPRQDTVVRKSGFPQQVTQDERGGARKRPRREWASDSQRSLRTKTLQFCLEVSGQALQI